MNIRAFLFQKTHTILSIEFLKLLLSVHIYCLSINIYYFSQIL